jgi:hypothetical protein
MHDLYTRIALVHRSNQGCKEEVDKFVPHPPEWSAVRIPDYGFGRLKIYNSSHLQFQQISDSQVSHEHARLVTV